VVSGAHVVDWRTSETAVTEVFVQVNSLRA
jgi:hypothetical protein